VGILERFESKFSKTSGCWVWENAKTRGYGVLNVEGKVEYAHRLSWQFYCGDIPTGMYILHHCDNRPCVNPEHLFLGTHHANMVDMRAKGRGKNPVYHGEGHPSTRLTNEKVLAIRLDKRVQTVIARDYGISQTHVSDIKLHKIWKHI